MTMCRYFGTFKLIIILWTSICLQDAQAIRKYFEVVKRCPFNESEWKVRAATTACNGSESYHCLMTEGGVLLKEQCTEASLFTSGFCPIFTGEGYLQWSVCKDTACPTSSYRSDEVYRYQICYRKSDNPKGKNTEQGSNNRSSVNGMKVNITVAISLVFILVLVSVLIVCYVRNQYGFKGKVQQCITVIRTHFQQSIDTESLKDAEKGESYELKQLLIQKGKNDETPQKTTKLRYLLKLLVHILKQELCISDLREKAVLHSKSINEHFTEQLLKYIQSLKDINDYSRLKTSLVFALLRNFCDGIKPPNRGWDYEPPDDETHVGADIERIRSMWNKYCDDDLQFEHLDEVYNRMILKYGTVAVHGDDGVRNPQSKDEENIGDLVKDKIHSIKLNEDCTVKEGIVITEHITSALKILQSKNVVILKGVIGCGKTHALKAIQNHFQQTDLETAWVESEIFHRNISYENSIIILCDNLFGQFGASVFSQDAVNKTEQVLKEIDRSIGKTKVIIGIHTHVYDEIKTSFKLDFIHQKNITVEMDNLSEAATLLIFKKQLREGHCKTDYDCWFRSVGFQSVLDKLSKNQGHIGGPFLSLMYCKEHELFSDEAFSVSPVKTLVQHFQKMRKDSDKLYICLVYLMCVQQHNIEDEPENWAGLIDVLISKHNVMNSARISKLLQVKNKIVTLAHELLTTALFKSAADDYYIVLPVIQLCDRNVFLQLLRPSDTCNTHGDLYCEYLYNNYERSRSREVGEICASRLADNYKKQEIKHPLMAIDFVKDKYLDYLNRQPKTLLLAEVNTKSFKKLWGPLTEFK